MDDPREADPDAGDGPALSAKVAAALALGALVTLAAGVVIFGTGGDEEAAGARINADGCRERPLRYGYTDSAKVRDQQQAFDRSPRALPAPGYYEDPPPDPGAALHTVSHGYVVIYYRPPAGGTPLEDLAGEAAATRQSVLVAPRPDQAEPLVAIRDGAQLTCTAGGAAQVAQVRAFTAVKFPSLEAPS